MELGGGIRQITLFEGSLKTIDNPATLNDSILNYDYLYIVTNYFSQIGTINSEVHTMVIKTSDIIFSSSDIFIESYKYEQFNEAIEFYFPTNNTIQLESIMAKNGDIDIVEYMPGITKIIGIKFLPILDYSLEEQNTGRKWIDGKDIYCKTVDFGAFSTTIRYTRVEHNITFDKCIKIEGTAAISDDNFHASVAWAQPLEEQPMKAIDFDMREGYFECLYSLTPQNPLYTAIATFYYTKKEGNE